MCYNKANNHIFGSSRPIERNETPIHISKLRCDTMEAVSLLEQVQQIRFYGDILTEPEQTSINELIKRLNGRIEAMKNLQQQFI